MYITRARRMYDFMGISVNAPLAKGTPSGHNRELVKYFAPTYVTDDAHSDLDEECAFL